jgi:hypothetical protein
MFIASILARFIRFILLLCHGTNRVTSRAFYFIPMAKFRQQQKTRSTHCFLFPEISQRVWGTGPSFTCGLEDWSSSASGFAKVKLEP